jgi:hypothetical protein
MRVMSVLAAVAALLMTSMVRPYAAEDRHDFIAVFAPGGNGDVAPVRVIDLPVGLRALSVDSAGDIYVADNYHSTVSVYSRTARGATAPVRTIGGPHTMLDHPSAIWIDEKKNLYVGSSDVSSRITIYAPGASGDQPPARVIEGKNSGLAVISGIATDAHDFLYVASVEWPIGSLAVYAPNADGDVAPLRSINFKTDGVASIGVSQDLVYLLAASGDGKDAHIIRAYGLGPAGLAAGPARTITSTAIKDSYSLAAGRDGAIYVPAGILPWHLYAFAPGAVGDAMPARNVSGEKTALFAGLSRNDQVASDQAGYIYFYSCHVVLLD